MATTTTVANEDHRVGFDGRLVCGGELLLDGSHGGQLLLSSSVHVVQLEAVDRTRARDRVGIARRLRLVVVIVVVSRGGGGRVRRCLLAVAAVRIVVVVVVARCFVVANRWLVVGVNEDGRGPHERRRRRHGRRSVLLLLLVAAAGRVRIGVGVREALVFDDGNGRLDAHENRIAAIACSSCFH